MPFYQKRGELPRKRHTVHRRASGRLAYEELMSREGFSGTSSLLYHVAMPTRVKRIGKFTPLELQRHEEVHRPRHLRTATLPADGDALSARVPLFFNEDLVISKAHPTRSQEDFFRNGHHDELLYIQEGSGALETQFGNLDFSPGDYLVIPRGVISRTRLDGAARILVLESPRPILTPHRYRNSFGQLLESSPFCERDIRTPVFQEPREEPGEFRVLTRVRGGVQELIYERHPFDLVGWDGYHFPWAFSIHDFEPIVGAIHQPPPIHQTFEGAGFVVCSFVSRPFDFHPEAIPAPYPHSNVDSEEILFYSEGDFMSRKGIEPESITFHPMGLAHGPQPGRYEESIGKKETQETAVMVDAFRPLQLTAEAARIDDPAYPLSWREED